MLLLFLSIVVVYSTQMGLAMFKDIYYHTASISNHNLIDYFGSQLVKSYVDVYFRMHLI